MQLRSWPIVWKMEIKSEYVLDMWNVSMLFVRE